MTTMDKKRILLVDDDPDMLAMLELFLTGAGYGVASAKDGMSCVSRVQKERPDLVVLDLGLPAGDGLATLGRLRGLMPSAETPVLVLTAREGSAWREKAMDAGANAYMRKPVGRDTLLAQVGALLGDSPASVEGSPSCPHCGGPIPSAPIEQVHVAADSISDVIRRAS
jgi:two-component system KDP operon response regulator KdpE